jgi:hypothetical protein
MRLYKKLKSLTSGTAASLNNKGLIVINPTGGAASQKSFTVFIQNYDNSITGITLAVGSANGTLAAYKMNPNYSFIPFHVTSWVDNSGGNLKGYELY